MKVTVNELAKQMGIDYPLASCLLKMAVATGQAKEIDKIKTSLTGKGKPSTVYEVNESLVFSLKKSTEAA